VLNFTTMMKISWKWEKKGGKNCASIRGYTITYVIN